MQTKVIKKMETFRVRNTAAGERRRLLLPLSLGASSVTLLHILNQHLERQRSRTGRTGFDLHVLHVNPGDGSAALETIGALKTRYPWHEYSMVELFARNVCEATDEAGPSLQSELNSLDSATFRADLAQIRTTQRIAQEARRLECEGVLWGHTTTALAEKILAETSKGRGFALPSTTQDGASSFGVNFLYPMRDVLRKEVLTFSILANPPLTDIIAEQAARKTQVSSKAATIDNLMKDYFASVEENYPSIVANVVRTTGKLITPDLDDATKCRICGLPVPNADRSMPNDIASESDIRHVNNASDEEICYGCERSFASFIKD